jgi:protein subunit release factor B
MKELLFSITKDDFEITYFSGSGAGGQHRNRHKNCVRIKHKETGIITTGQSQRSLEQNKKDAFVSMINHFKFKQYLRLRTAKENGIIQDIEKLVDEEMKENNLKIEYL